MSAGQAVAPLQSLIGSRIVVLREQRVMLDSDFMFQLAIQYLAALRSQIVTSNTGHGGRRTAPYAFTEQGVAMLSSVLNSPRAIVVNIEIMRTFVRVRELATTHGDLAARLNELEEKTEAPLGVAEGQAVPLVAHTADDSENGKTVTASHRHAVSANS